jgi:hypothetical protein
MVIANVAAMRKQANCAVNNQPRRGGILTAQGVSPGAGRQDNTFFVILSGGSVSPARPENPGRTGLSECRPSGAPSGRGKEFSAFNQPCRGGNCMEKGNPIRGKGQGFSPSNQPRRGGILAAQGVSPGTGRQGNTFFVILSGGSVSPARPENPGRTGLSECRPSGVQSEYGAGNPPRMSGIDFVSGSPIRPSGAQEWLAGRADERRRHPRATSGRATEFVGPGCAGLRRTPGRLI